MLKFFIGLILGFTLGIIAITKLSERQLHRNAIAHKLGEYTVNRTNGDVKFTWFPPPTNNVVILREY